MSLIPRKSASESPGFLNPKQIIQSAMLDLEIGPEKETVASNSLSDDMFVADLGEWGDFNKEVSTFYQDLEFRKAFELCEDVDADLDLLSLVKDVPNFAALEHTQIGDERDLHGRFLSNVTNRVVSALKFMLDQNDIPEFELLSLKALPLRADVNVGSAKTVPKKQRKQHEPDVVFKIPGSGDNQRVRLVGELKFPRTCRMKRYWGDVESKKFSSMRHIFGQIARDMKENGTRFGFISTYEDTVFLKIVEQGHKYDLLYSEPIPHHHSVIEGGVGCQLSQISVRLAMLFLLYRASHEDDRSWHVDTSLFTGAWTKEFARGDDGKQAAAYKSSPFKTVRESIEKNYERLSRALRKRRVVTSTPATPDYHGPSPDDPADETYLDTDTPITRNRLVSPKISPAPSSSSYLGQNSHAPTWNREKNRDALNQLRRSNFTGLGARQNISVDDPDA